MIAAVTQRRLCEAVASDNLEAARNVTAGARVRSGTRRDGRHIRSTVDGSRPARSRSALLLRQIQIGQRAVERLGRHRHGLRQRRVRMDRQADVRRIAPISIASATSEIRSPAFGADDAAADDAMRLPGRTAAW